MLLDIIMKEPLGKLSHWLVVKGTRDQAAFHFSPSHVLLPFCSMTCLVFSLTLIFAEQ